MSPRHGRGGRPHILTVAIEDYYQVGAFNRWIHTGQWYRFESRVESNTLRALDLLDEFGIKATFFALGWIADQVPDVIREVARRGHELASKGYYHRSIRQMTTEEFRDDLVRSRAALECASGRKVRGYRVAHEWLKAEDLWALDVLAEEGFAYDSSIGPLLRWWAHEPWRRFIHTHHHAGRTLTEVPLSSLELLGWSFPIAGGNYFRQFPHTLMKRGVAHWHSKHDSPFVMYFHVWELDAQQPEINAPLLTRVRHYRNLGKLDWVLRDYFRRYRFGGIGDYLGLASAPVDASAPEPAADRSPERGPERAGAAQSVRRVAAPAPAATPAPAARDAAGRLPVTIVVPCFNEELVLPYLANTLASVEERLGKGFDLSFVFVDDCSRDQTLAALRRLFGSRPNCRIVRHTRNRGVAAAILTGIRHAGTDVVCSIDCDCTYDPHQLEALLPRLEPGVDMVTASPYHPLGRVLNVPPWRLVLSKGLSRLYRITLRQKLATYTSCFRVYRRSSLVDLPVREGGFLGIAEMVGLLDLRGGRVVETPAVLEVRMLGRSKMKIASTILGHLRLLARIWRLKLQPGRLAAGDAGDAGAPPELGAGAAPTGKDETPR